MNQGIDRIAALAEYFERALILVPFREPRFQAASLLRQSGFTDVSDILGGYGAWEQARTTA